MSEAEIWEYKVVRIDVATCAEAMDVLNALGEETWELVSIVHHEFCLAFLKRPKIWMPQA